MNSKLPSSMEKDPSFKESIESGSTVEPMIEVDKVLNGIADIVIIVDTHGVAKFLNEHALKFSYFTEHGFGSGSNIFDRLPAGWQSLANNVLNELKTGAPPSTLDATYAPVEGRQIHFEIKCSSIRNTGDTVTHILIEARDVSTQKIFEKKITRFASEYQDLIEHANAVIIGTDSRGYITEWNRMARQTTGFSKDEAYTKKLAGRILDPEDQQDFSTVIENIVQGSIVTNHEINVRAKNGRRLTFLVNGTPRRNTLNEVIGILLIGQDVTELTSYRKSLEQKVHDRTEALQAALQKEKQLVEIKNRFVSIASHEFRSPLSGIRSHVAHFKKTIHDISTQDAVARLDNIAAHVNHMTVLLEDVLTVGKNEADKLKIRMGRVELKSFFEKVIEEVEQSTNNTHSVQLNCSLPALVIESDEKLLRNIFINLLSNAIKYSPGKNCIFLFININEQAVDITVKDEGIGIDESETDRIFEPFTRGRNAKDIKGTGLGLSIVKKAVETLNGKLFLQSRPGEGTIFTISLNR